jgi:hypothetical protein
MIETAAAKGAMPMSNIIISGTRKYTIQKSTVSDGYDVFEDDLWVHNAETESDARDWIAFDA